MNLIRLGRTYLNMDRATQVTDLSRRDAGGQLIDGLVRIEFGDGPAVEISRDAAQVIAWLDQQSTHLPPPDTP